MQTNNLSPRLTRPLFAVVPLLLMVGMVGHAQELLNRIVNAQNELSSIMPRVNMVAVESPNQVPAASKPFHEITSGLYDYTKTRDKNTLFTPPGFEVVEIYAPKRKACLEAVALMNPKDGEMIFAFSVLNEKDTQEQTEPGALPHEFRAADSFFCDAFEHYHDDRTMVSVTGHSRGAAVAHYLSMKHNVRSVIFDAARSPQAALDEARAFSALKNYDKIATGLCFQHETRPTIPAWTVAATPSVSTAEIAAVPVATPGPVGTLPVSLATTYSYTPRLYAATAPKRGVDIVVSKKDPVMFELADAIDKLRLQELDLEREARKRRGLSIANAQVDRRIEEDTALPTLRRAPLVASSDVATPAENPVGDAPAAAPAPAAISRQAAVPSAPTAQAPATPPAAPAPTIAAAPVLPPAPVGASGPALPIVDLPQPEPVDLPVPEPQPPIQPDIAGNDEPVEPPVLAEPEVPVENPGSAGPVDTPADPGGAAENETPGGVEPLPEEEKAEDEKIDLPVAEPITLGNNHVQIEAKPGVFGSLTGFEKSGIPTLPEAISNGRGTFVGPATAHRKVGDDISTLTGTMMMDADLGNRTIQGKIDLASETRSLRVDIDPVDIGDGSFSAPARGDEGSTGSMNATMYGPNGETLGTTTTLQRGDGARTEIGAYGEWRPVGTTPEPEPEPEPEPTEPAPDPAPQSGTSSSDNSVTLVTPETITIIRSTDNVYKYMEVDGWSPSTGLQNPFNPPPIQGPLTDMTTMPNSGTAIYNGKFHGALASPGSPLQAVQGDASLRADYAKRTIEGAIISRSSAVPDLSTRATWNAGVNRVQGTVSGGGFEGDIDGAFYGRTGPEFGARVRARRGNSLLGGILRAVRKGP